MASFTEIKYKRRIFTWQRSCNLVVFLQLCLLIHLDMWFLYAFVSSSPEIKNHTTVFLCLFSYHSCTCFWGMRICTWNTKIGISWSFFLASFLFVTLWERAAYWIPGLGLKYAWLANKTSLTPYTSCFSHCWSYTHAPPCSTFTWALRDKNSGHCAYIASISLS